mgnify:CR=1 FL=1
MNITDKAAMLLKEFAQARRISDLSFDEEGGCVLVDEQDRVIHLQIDQTFERLLALSALGALPAPVHCRPEVLYDILAANFCWAGSCGGTLAVEPGSGEAVIQYALPLADADASAFAGFMDEFAQLAIYWRERLDSILAVNSDADNPFAAEEETGSLAEEALIRV